MTGGRSYIPTMPHNLRRLRRQGLALLAMRLEPKVVAIETGASRSMVSRAMIEFGVPPRTRMGRPRKGAVAA